MSFILVESRINAAAENSIISDFCAMAERQNAQIIGLSQSRKLFYTDFCEEFSYNSNAIEGNRVTLPETFEILRKNVTVSNKPLKDQMEVVGHAKAFDYLVDVATNEKMPLSKELMLTVHKMILEENDPIAGRFRGFGEDVGVRDTSTGKVYHRGINPLALHENLDGIIENYNDLSKDKSINKIALLAGFHLCFEMIHPFLDGNGRTGRLLVNFELIKHGYLPIDVKFTERPLYYAAFEKPDDYTRMTELFARSMLSSIAMYRQLHEKFISGRGDEPPIYQADTVKSSEFAKIEKINQPSGDATMSNAPRIRR